MKTTIEGELEKVIYSNEENAFTVAKLKVAGQKESVTIVGSLLSPKTGDLFRIEGEWAEHKVYGSGEGARCPGHPLCHSFVEKHTKLGAYR